MIPVPQCGSNAIRMRALLGVVVLATVGKSSSVFYRSTAYSFRRPLYDSKEAIVIVLKVAVR
jgi:hypothetical protein